MIFLKAAGLIFVVIAAIAAALSLLYFISVGVSVSFGWEFNKVVAGAAIFVVVFWLSTLLTALP